MQSETLSNKVLLRRTSQAARVIVVVLATFILPKSTAAAQQSAPMSGQPPVVGVTTRQFVQRIDIRSKRLASRTPTSLRDSTSIRPIIIGVVLGGAVGALVGHEIAGAPQSCPTSPNHTCGNAKLGTVGFAVSGALIGGIAGFLITRWR